MIEHFDLSGVEKMFHLARSAMGKSPAQAAQRLQLYPEVVETLGKSVVEIKRLRERRATELADAMEEMRAIIRKEIDEALGKHAKLMLAAQGVRNHMSVRSGDGVYLWAPTVPEKEFSGACDRLFIALREAQS